MTKKQTLQASGGSIAVLFVILAMYGTTSAPLFIFYVFMIFVGAMLLKASENF